jgi:hypothetical protein
MKFVGSFDWSNRNRLYISREYINRHEWFVVLEYGNRNSDPVWSIGFESHKKHGL